MTVATHPKPAAPSAPRSKLKAVEPKAARPSKPKVLVFGKAGAGKTWAALDFPGVYYIDTEGGADLAHYTDKLTAAGGVYFGPDQGSQDFATVIEQVQALATERHPHRTVVIDSVTKLFNIEIAKEAERLGDKDGFGASKKPAVSYTRRLLNWIDRLDLNVVLIAHERVMWANEKQVGVTYDAWDKLEYELHLCLNVVKQGDSRKAFVKKTRLTGFPDGTAFPWSYAEFAERYGKDVIEGAVEQIVLATPEQLAELDKILAVMKVTDAETAKWFAKARVAAFDEMSADTVSTIITNLKGKLP